RPAPAPGAGAGDLRRGTRLPVPLSAVPRHLDHFLGRRLLQGLRNRLATMRAPMSDPVVTPLRTEGRAPRVLTIDAEAWFQVCGEEAYAAPRRWDAFAPRVEKTVGWLLDALARGGHRATFFFLGWIAERYPHLPRETRRRGHEVGVHGDLHRRA